MSDRFDSSRFEFDAARDPALETRAAVDVMFEALAHIQASMETTSKEAREQTYRQFKAALEERFEAALEQRYAQRKKARESETSSGEDRTTERDASEHQPGDAPDESVSTGDGAPGTDPEEISLEERDDEDKDTLDKLWPSISP